MTIIKCMTYQNKSLLLLGEIHTKTEIQFATKFLENLEDKCNLKRSKYAFFVERHVKSESERSVPELLACNKSDDIAIQNVRCAPIVNFAKNSCDSLDVHSIDIRHIDYGFLRYELFEIRHSNPEFRKAYDVFVSHANRQLQHFLTQFSGKRVP